MVTERDHPGDPANSPGAAALGARGAYFASQEFLRDPAARRRFAEFVAELCTRLGIEATVIVYGAVPAVEVLLRAPIPPGRLTAASGMMALMDTLLRKRPAPLELKR